MSHLLFSYLFQKSTKCNFKNKLTRRIYKNYNTSNELNNDLDSDNKFQNQKEVFQKVSKPNQVTDVKKSGQRWYTRLQEPSVWPGMIIFITVETLVCLFYLRCLITGPFIHQPCPQNCLSVPSCQRLLLPRPRGRAEHGCTHMLP